MSRDDDAWAELVEAFHTSPESQPGEAPRWPDAENVTPGADAPGDLADEVRWPADDLTDDLTGDLAGPADQVAAGPQASPRPSADDDHFVPPVPPPIPRGDPVSRLAWAGVGVPPVALIVMTVTGWTPPSWLMGLLVAAFVGGFATLVARMRGHHPHDPLDPDDGAVL